MGPGVGMPVAGEGGAVCVGLGNVVSVGNGAGEGVAEAQPADTKTANPRSRDKKSSRVTAFFDGKQAAEDETGSTGKIP